MRWLWVALIFATVSLWGATTALAQGGPPPDTPEPPQRSQKLSKGQPAPFTGMLMALHTAAVIAEKAERCDERVDLARREEQELAALSVESLRDSRKDDRETCDLKLNLMQGAIDKSQPSWFDHPIIWTTLGGLIVAGALAVTAALLDATRPTVITVDGS